MSGTGLVLHFHHAGKPGPFDKNTLKDIIIKIPRGILAPHPVRTKFNQSASDPLPEGRGKPHDTKQLWEEVVKNDGVVPAAKARQFVDDFLKGAFTRDSRINDPRTKQDLSALGFDALIHLYEAIASEKTKGMSIFLQAINKALDLGKNFYEKRVEPISEFFADKNKAWLEKKWLDAKQDGQIGAKESGFADSIAEFMALPEVTTKDEVMRRVAALQFICNAYSDFIGETRVDVKLFNADPNFRGFHANQPSGEIIGINLQLMNSFQTAIGVLMHERQHASQDRLAEALKAGKIKDGDPDYLAARIFAANRGKNGYISPEAKAGHWGYRYQPLELDAHNAGYLSEYLVFKNFAKKPDIIHRPSDNGPDLKAA